MINVMMIGIETTSPHNKPADDNKEVLNGSIQADDNLDQSEGVLVVVAGPAVALAMVVVWEVAAADDVAEVAATVSPVEVAGRAGWVVWLC